MAFSSVALASAKSITLMARGVSSPVERLERGLGKERERIGKGEREDRRERGLGKERERIGKGEREDWERRKRGLGNEKERKM